MQSRELLDTRAAYFMAVVEEGSFSAAARQLMVSQPAVSQQVGALESRLGCVLLNRSGYRPVPTDAGKRLYRELKSASDGLIQALDDVAPKRATLTIGFTGASQNQGLLAFAKQYRTANPELDIVFRKASFGGGRELLLAGDVDCCFGITTTYEGLAEVACEKLFDYELCVICSHDNPLAQRNSVSPTDLTDQDFVVLAPEYGRDFHRAFMENLRADGVRPHISRTVDSFDELVLDVSIGRGIAVVSREVVSEREVAVLPLVASKASSSYALAYLRSNQDPALASLAQAAKEFFRTTQA